jgi:DNA polymerase I-like protein with 3'-5' exonuclease and polymerase domains
MEGADELVGHNILAFDLPALHKVYKWKPRLTQRLTDTHVLSRLIYPDIKANDSIMGKKRNWIAPKLRGKHTLDAWGQRLGEPKDDYIGWCYAQDPIIDEPFAEWRQEMEDYCDQDVSTNVKLLEHLTKRLADYSQESVDIEHDVSVLLRRQQTWGWEVDVKRIEALYTDLRKRQIDLEAELRAAFPPFYLRAGKDFTPKRDNKKMGYCEGAKLTKVKLVEFSPGSRQNHVANRLMHRYNWKPKQYTPTGEPKIDEAVLLSLPYKEAPALAEWYGNDKRMGAIADGKQSWMKHMRYRDNNMRARIHPVVIHNGAVTGRMAHHTPPVAQVPRVGNPYGVEMRSCWITTPGFVLVGCDAEGIEMRALAHYMAKYDGGTYAQAVATGKKEDGTDPHSLNASAMELVSFGVAVEIARDTGKTVFYAMIYGAGDFKIGQIVLKAAKARATRQRCVHVGRQVRAKLQKNLPALIKVINAVRSQVRKRGWLKGLDGRRLDIRSEHSSFNMLLQSFGAIVMKKALLLLDARLQFELKLQPGKDYEFVGNIHDEWQIDAKPDYAQAVGERAAQAIADAGKHFNSRCELSGGFDVGSNWAETH